MNVDKSKWQHQALEDCCKILLGTRIVKKETEPGEYFVYGGGDATFTTKEYNREDAILIARFALSSQCTRFIKGKFYLNDSGLTVEPKVDNLIFNFLKWHIFAFNDKIYSLAKGVAQKNLNMKRFPHLMLKVPSLDEQRGIAAELDAVQAMIDGYKVQLAELDTLAQSIFLDTFGDPISNPKGWETKSIKAICRKMSTGPFGSMLHKEDYDIDGVPSINPQDIKGNYISDENIALVNYTKAQSLNKYFLHENDIVIARRGDLRKCAVISKNQEGWLCGTGSFFLSLNNCLIPILFYYFYTSESVQKFINDKCIGATMPNLNQGILAAIKFPVPPLALQQQFAEQVEAIEKQKELLRQQISDAETLMAERMQYYFS